MFITGKVRVLFVICMSVVSSEYLSAMEGDRKTPPPSYQEVCGAMSRPLSPAPRPLTPSAPSLSQMNNDPIPPAYQACVMHQPLSSEQRPTPPAQSLYSLVSNDPLTTSDQASPMPRPLPAVHMPAHVDGGIMASTRASGSSVNEGTPFVGEHRSQEGNGCKCCCCICCDTPRANESAHQSFPSLQAATQMGTETRRPSMYVPSVNEVTPLVGRSRQQDDDCCFYCCCKCCNDSEDRGGSGCCGGSSRSSFEESNNKEKDFCDEHPVCEVCLVGCLLLAAMGSS